MAALRLAMRGGITLEPGLDTNIYVTARDKLTFIIFWVYLVDSDNHCATPYNSIHGPSLMARPTCLTLITRRDCNSKGLCCEPVFKSPASYS